MNKCITLALALGLSVSSAFAAAGIYDDDVVINANNGGNFYYGLGNGTHQGTFNNRDFGTFDTSAGASLLLNGGEVFTYKSDSSDVTGASIFYNVHLDTAGQGSFTEVPMNFGQDFGYDGGGFNHQRWDKSTAAKDLLAGLANGSYTLEIFSKAYTNGQSGAASEIYDSNNGSNFKASFTVVPEPSSIVSMLGTSLMGLLYLVRRRRA